MELRSKAAREAFFTTAMYVKVFYPLWFYHQQSRLPPTNRLLGPERMSPLFGLIVAPNDDTLYAATPMNLAGDPVILTIPETTTTYSLLSVDYFGNVFETGIPPATPGTYALIGPGWSGALPHDIIPIEVPEPYSVWVIRSDNGVDPEEADLFRRSLRLAPLAEYLQDPTAGATLVVPVAFYAVRFKAVADRLIEELPIAFLEQLREAVRAPETPPLSPFEQRLSDRFDQLFDDLNADSALGFIAGARRAHARILRRYVSNTGTTNWITFTNIGAWGRRYLDRAAIAEFLQITNTRNTAAYYHAFEDRRGAQLNARARSCYVLTFPRRRIPEAKRFWSVTAYLPESITLVPNDAEKYVVASYTPGLETGPDGSISIYMTPELPSTIPAANWLPVPIGQFNVILRVYGPEGSVANNTFVPPGIESLGPDCRRPPGREPAGASSAG
ncbi:MAG: DUF1214 domain-containing protein [Pseudomonadota bacterium]